MGFSVKKRDMHKLALFPPQICQKIHTKKRDKAKKKWDSSVFIKNRDGWRVW